MGSQCRVREMNAFLIGTISINFISDFILNDIMYS